MAPTLSRVHVPFGKLPNGRKRFCGAWTVKGMRRPGIRGNGNLRRQSSSSNGRVIRLRCKSWSCSCCGPRKANRYRHRIMRAAQQHGLTRFLTLTLDPRNMGADQEVLEIFYRHLKIAKAAGEPCACGTCGRLQRYSLVHVRSSWAKLRTYMRRTYGRTPNFISVLEFQKCSGLAHLHVIVDRYIAHQWLKHAWQAVGGGQHVHIQYVDVQRSARYLAKYLSKDVLLSAPAGIRRISTSRSITLNDSRESEYSWKLIKATIDRVYVYLREIATELMHVEGELDSFSIRE